MPECPIARLSNWRFGSRRDETRRDDARHGATRGMSLAEEQARRQNEVYDALIRELERVPDDARGAVASFLQDLRRDGVDWYRVGDGGEFDVDDKESFFRTVRAGACVRATRIMGSGCLKFAREHLAPWDEWTCASAARNGNLDCLKYAHENGCPWDEKTCRYAAENGHLECLKYAHENGCPWDYWTYFCAMSNGNMEVILFLIEREHPRTQSLRLTWEKVAMPILPDADAVIGLEIALSRHRHRHDADGGHVSLREILPFWREHRRLYDEAHRAARVDALLPEIDEERRRVTDAG